MKLPYICELVHVYGGFFFNFLFSFVPLLLLILVYCFFFLRALVIHRFISFPATSFSIPLLFHISLHSSTAGPRPRLFLLMNYYKVPKA